MDGRIRIRDTSLERAELGHHLTKTLRKAKGILGADVNEISGSMLIQYDPGQTNLDTIKGLIPSSIWAEGTSRRSPEDGKVVDLALWKRRNTNRLTMGRVVKGGMLSSLSVCLLFGLMGRKELHLLAGLVFLGFLQLHMTKHKNRLFS